MATSLFPAKKRQQYLILALALVVILALVFVWRNLLAKPAATEEVTPVFFPTEIKINWAALQNEKLTKLQPFADITPFTDTVGRKDPFVSY